MDIWAAIKNRRSVPGTTTLVKRANIVDVMVNSLLLRFCHGEIMGNEKNFSQASQTNNLWPYGYR